MIDIGNGVVSGSYSIDGVSVTLVGSDDPSDTVLEGGGGVVFIVTGSTGTPTVIRGFTITGGGGSSGLNGTLEAVVSLVDSNVVIEDCVLSGNTGGAIHAVGGAPTIRDSSVVGNSIAGDGAGIRLESSAALISNVTFASNTASGSGGGIAVSGGSPVIMGCIFQDNVATAGGGLAWQGEGSTTVVDALFSDNVAAVGGAIYSAHGSGALLLDTVGYCGNGEAAISGDVVELGPVVGSDACIDCDGSGVIDVIEIARGDLVDADGDGTVDLCESCLGDIDGDGMVDGSDLGILLFEWGAGPSAADLDGDGQVSGSDLGILLFEWGFCLD